jgi:hypothetical protein
MTYKETQYGFEYGPAHIQREFSDTAKGCVILGLETRKYTGANSLQIFVTKSGKVWFHDAKGEWTPPGGKK